MPAKKPEAVIYARVSSKRQVEEGNGNKSQIQACTRYADSKGWKVIKVFEEPGISGSVAEREEMEELLRFLKERHRQCKRTIVIVDDLKRFSRDIGIYIALKGIVISCGAELASPKFNFEDSPEGEFIEHITVLSGQLERKQNRRQVIDRMKSRLEMGYWCFAAPVPGLKYAKEIGHGKVMRRDEPKASIYAEALEGYASGRFSNKRSIAVFLEQRLHKHFTDQSADDVLDRAVTYAGYIEYPKWEVARRKGHHDALISLETCLQIQERLNGSTRKNIRKDVNPEFPLRGHVQCEACGKGFRAAWCKGRSKKYPKYWCSNRNCEYYSSTIDRKDIEGDFEELLQTIKPEGRTLEAVKRRMLRKWEKRINDIGTYHNSIAKEIKGITEEVDDLVDRIPLTPHRMVVTAYENRIEKLELEKIVLKEKETKYRLDNFDYRTALEEVINFIKDPHARWKSGILGERLCVLDICFTKDVQYHPKEGYRTTQLSPTFAALTNNTAVLESTHTVHLQGCGHGSKKFELSESNLEQLFKEVKQFYWMLDAAVT